MYVTGVGTVAKKYEKRRGEYSEWGLGFSVPNSLGQPLQHDVRYVLFQLRAAAIYTMPDTPFLYLSGIVTTEPCPFSSLTQSPLQFPPKSSMTSLLTDVEWGGIVYICFAVLIIVNELQVNWA